MEARRVRNESSAERDRNAHVPERLTGSSLLAQRDLPAVQDGWTLIATVTYDRETKSVEFKRECSPDEDAPSE